MSEVTSQKLLNLLEQMGRCYRFPGRIFLVGGTSLIIAGSKTSTFDIDLDFEIEPEHHAEFIRCLRQLSRDLKLPVEQVSPADFMPLPDGYQNRHQFVERYGSLDVYHFDFYSVALSKLHRGNEKDFTDVVNMVETGLIDLEKLKQDFNEVLPKLEEVLSRTTPEDFLRKFELFEQRILNGMG
jgi:hypothetical protein